jgi:hypothetical protein
VIACVALVTPLLLLTQGNRGDGVTLAAGLWQPDRRPLAMSAVVAVVLAAIVLVAFLRTLRRSVTRPQTVFDDAGI